VDPCGAKTLGAGSAFKTKRIPCDSKLPVIPQKWKLFEKSYGNYIIKSHKKALFETIKTKVGVLQTHSNIQTYLAASNISNLKHFPHFPLAATDERSFVL